jgi:hypothetical protein
MSIRQISGREASDLKTASQQLVEAAGGVKLAADLTQASASRMSEAISSFHDTRWLTLVQVADLEATTEQPIITRTLAAMAGFDLVPREAARSLDMHHHLARVVKETGDATSALSQALADGKLDAAEIARVQREVEEGIAALQALMLDCDRLAGRKLREVK